MDSLTIPISSEALTPEWLTEALRSTGTLTKGVVSRIETDHIGEGEGVMSETVRVRLFYEPGEPDAITSLVAKFPTQSIDRFFVARMLRFYERECGFYTELQAQIPLRTPHCYYNAIEESTGAFVLLLEDLAYADPGDQVEGCHGADLDLAVDQLAALHASCWEDPRLDTLTWIPGWDDKVIVPFFEHAFKKAWEWLQKERPTLFSPADRAIGDRLSGVLVPLLKRITEAPRTLIHGDYRSDNLFFLRAPDVPSVVISDWQTLTLGRGPFDLGYFLTQSTQPELRRAQGTGLVRRYHDGLVKNGVEGYSYETCVEDYRRSVLLSLAYPVVAARTMSRMTTRGRELAVVMMNRAMAAIHDLSETGPVPWPDSESTAE